MGGAKGRSSLPTASPGRQELAEGGLGLREHRGEDFSRKNRLMSPGLSPFQLPSCGPGAAPEKLSGVGRELCKVLECQVPKDPGEGRPEPQFSLTVGLSLWRARRGSDCPMTWNFSARRPWSAGDVGRPPYQGLGM